MGAIAKCGHVQWSAEDKRCAEPRCDRAHPKARALLGDLQTKEIRMKRAFKGIR